MNKVVFKYQGDAKYKGYYDSLMESLKDLSDEKSQVKAWKKGNYDFGEIVVEGNKNHIFFYNFPELSSHFIEDCATIFALYKEVGFSQNQLQMIKKLHHMVENYNGSTEERDEEGWAVTKTDAQIADDPEWHKIRDYAKYVYSELTKDQ